MESEANISGEDVTVVEFFGYEHFFSAILTSELTNIPGEVFLENTFTSDAKFLAKCIEARFCGGGLPTAIKDCHVGIRNLSDFVAVKANNRDASFGIEVNRSVCRLPIDVLLNSGTHLGFDLTHDERREVIVGGGVVSSPR